MTNNADYFTKVQAIGRAFTPSAPMTDRDMFAGRQAQLRTLVMVAAQKGQHALVYGVRGAGKTSLARVAQEILNEGGPAPYYVCNSGDTFKSLWRAIFNEIQLITTKQPIGFESAPTTQAQSAGALLGEDVTPHSVSQSLAYLGGMQSLVIVIDEFDRPTDNSVRTFVADTIKILADRSVPVTIVLVGVAGAVSELLGEHESIQRSLVQIEMPPMNEEEIRDLITRGMTAADLRADESFTHSVVALSQGLPHYTHLLCLHAAMNCVENERDVVTEDDLTAALANAIEAASQTVREQYHSATFSNRETLYKAVLLACAMAPKDELGSFGAPDVRDQMRQITKQDYEIPSFAGHLKEFSSDGPRGGVLQRIGTQRRFRYRFVDPLMPTYVLMQGKREGLA